MDFNSFTGGIMNKIKYFSFLIFTLMLIVGCSNNSGKVSHSTVKKQQEIQEQDLYINGKKEKVKVFKNVKKYNVEYKDKLFVLDESQYEKLKKEDNKLLLTFDKKIIENFDKNNIDTYRKYGTFYQVLLKNGETLQFFDKPSAGKEASGDDLNSRIVGVYKHGDHWHVKLDDGSEYITHDDPTQIIPNVKVGKYEGSHDGKEKNINLTKNKEKKEKPKKSLNLMRYYKIEELKDKGIVKASVHGDHWHLFDANGKEYITHEDPRGKLDGVKIEEYTGKGE